MNLEWCKDTMCLVGWALLGYGILTGALFKYLRLLDHLLFTMIEDLGSLRNKLVFFCLTVTYIAVKSGNEWAIGGTCALTTIILKVYFDGRQQSTILTKNNGNHTPKFEQWDQQYGVVQLAKKTKEAGVSLWNQVKALKGNKRKK